MKRNKRHGAIACIASLVLILCIAGLLFYRQSNHAPGPETGAEKETDVSVGQQGKAANGQQDGRSENAGQSGTAELVMVGDVLMHDCLIRAGEQPDGSRDYSEFFSHMQAYFTDADLALVNQETVLGGEQLGFSGYPAFNSPTEVGDAEAAAGFDVILHATNHALDKGAAGIENDLHFWRTAHPEIRVLGTHDSQTDEDTNRIGYFDVNGIRIAVINATYGTNGISVPAGKPYLVDYLGDRVLSDIDEAERNADFTVVCPHWGIEYRFEPTEAQQEMAAEFAAHGADLVIGTHPHVIEPVEWVTDAATGHRMLCYYSLGNYINGTSDSGAGIWKRMVGGMADVRLERGSDGTVLISDYAAVPVICQWNGTKTGFTSYAWPQYTDALAASNGIRAQDGTFSMDGIRTLISDVWPGVKTMPLEN